MEQSRLYEVAKELLTKYGDPPKAKPHFMRKLLADRKLLDALAFECLSITQALGAGQLDHETQTMSAQPEVGGGQEASETQSAGAAAAEARAGHSMVETHSHVARPAPNKPISVKPHTKVYPATSRHKQRTESQKEAERLSILVESGVWKTMGVDAHLHWRELSASILDDANNGVIYLQQGEAQMRRVLFKTLVLRHTTPPDDGILVVEAVSKETAEKLARQAIRMSPDLAKEVISRAASGIVDTAQKMIAAE